MTGAFRERGVGGLLSSQKTRPYQIAVVGVLLLVLIIDGIDIQLLSLVAPVILEDWSVERSEFGPALAGALIGMSLGSVFGGALGDRLGRLKMLLVSTFVFGAATIIAGFAASVWEMTAFRILSGLGFGAAAPNAIALANDWLPDRLKAKVTSLLSVGTPAGGMVGASLVIAMLPTWGWRATFFASGALTILLVFVIIAFVSESPSYLVSKGRHEKARGNLMRRLGLDLLPQIVDEELKISNETAGKRGLLTRPNLRLNVGAGLGFFCVALVSYGFVGWTPIMLTSSGFEIDQALTAIFAFNLAAVSAAVAAGFAMAAFGSRKVMAISASLLVLVTIALAMVIDGANHSPDLQVRIITYVLVGCAGGFAGSAMASVYAMMAVGYPVQCRAGGLGFGMMLGRGGGILASFLGGYLLEMGSGVWAFLIFLAANAAVAVTCAFISDRHVEPDNTRFPA